MIPGWGELFERIGWLCYHAYRDQRKAWRRWRATRRMAKRAIPVIPPQPTVGTPIEVSDASLSEGLKNLYVAQAPAQPPVWYERRMENTWGGSQMYFDVKSYGGGGMIPAEKQITWHDKPYYIDAAGWIKPLPQDPDQPS